MRLVGSGWVALLLRRRSLAGRVLLISGMRCRIYLVLSTSVLARVMYGTFLTCYLIWENRVEDFSFLGLIFATHCRGGNRGWRLKSFRVKGAKVNRSQNSEGCQKGQSWTREMLSRECLEASNMAVGQSRMQTQQTDNKFGSLRLRLFDLQLYRH